MILWMKAKLTTIIIATVAVFTVAGASAVFAAQNHNNNAAGASSQQAQGFEAQGVIQQVTFDQGTTQSGSLVFLPNKKQTAITVTFTTATKIEVEGDDSGSNDGQNANGAQQGTLQAGMSAEVEGTLQADGSVLARGIEAHVKGANDNDDDDNNNNGDHRIVGVIQSVDQNAQTFVLLPDGQTTPVTIAFDSKTNVEDGHDGGGNNAGLVAGTHVEVEAVTRADGSLYAKEIKPASNNEGNGGQGGDDGGDGHNGQPTPTPGTGGDNGGNGGSGSGD